MIDADTCGIIRWKYRNKLLINDLYVQLFPGGSLTKQTADRERSALLDRQR